MAQTITTKTPTTLLRMATGTYYDTGTVAAYTFSDLGFKPRYVKVVNETDKTQIEWQEGMADAEGIVTVANGTRTLVTSEGITVSDRGFIFGLDTDVNVMSKQCSWVAFG